MWAIRPGDGSHHSDRCGRSQEGRQGVYNVLADRAIVNSARTGAEGGEQNGVAEGVQQAGRRGDEGGEGRIVGGCSEGSFWFSAADRV